MSSEQPLTNRVRTCRIARGWSQDDLAARAGISRTGVSSIEINRLVPSTSTALALAAALECRVEDLFQLGTSGACEAAWAWQPNREPCRYWRASIAGRELMYPTEPTNLGVIAHDGVYQEGQFREQLTAAPSDTLVVASCDPAIALLANELHHRSNFRLLAFSRSSKEALTLLRKGWCMWPAFTWPQLASKNRTQLLPKRSCKGVSICYAERTGRKAWPLPRAFNSRVFARLSNPEPAGWGEKPGRRLGSYLTNCCRIVARHGALPMDIAAWQRPFDVVGQTWAFACVWLAMKPDWAFLASARNSTTSVIQPNLKEIPAFKLCSKRCGHQLTVAYLVIFPAMMRWKLANLNESFEL